MHGIGAHSAIAIKRQRRRRENARRGKGGRSEAAQREHDMSNKVMGTITMFHVGAVFLTVGLFLMLAAVITNETNKAEIAELIGTGVVCLVIGLFLVILNRFYGQREEEELQNYVETRLARTRSGQRLYHETDSYDNLDANCRSKTPSMDSGLSNDHLAKQKKGAKNTGHNQPHPHPHPSSSGGSGHGQHNQHQQSGPTTVHIINENQNQHNHHHSKPSEGVSPEGVTLDRISEENDNIRRGMASQGYSNYNEDHRGGGSGSGGNLYRVYDATTA